MIPLGTMRPFISPARIVLLTMIDMYCSDAIVDSDDDDFFLQLIHSYLNDAYQRPTNRRQRYLTRWQRAYLNVDLLTRLQSLQPALQSCSPVASPTDPETGEHPPDPPRCATLWDDLVATLWLRFRTLDSLTPFFDTLATHVAPTYSELRTRREMGLEDPPETQVQLDRRSPLGQFVYQACIEFARLSFSGQCDLWEDFVRYRNASRADFRSLWPHDYPVERLMLDANLADSEAQWGAVGQESVARVVFDRMLNEQSIPVSSDEVERLIAFLIERERLGFRPDPALREATDDAIADATLVPVQSIYYRLTDAWRMGDMNTAYDELHRYYDLVARQGPNASIGYSLGPMSKGIMQRDFGEHPDDLLSVLDAVDAGREMRDQNFLRFSLIWLFLYVRTHPRYIRPHQLQGLAGNQHDSKQVLSFIRQQAVAGHSTADYTHAFLLEARVALSDGRPPIHAKRCLVDGSRMIVSRGEHALEGQLASTTMVFWNQLGHAPLGLVYGRAFMCTRQDDVPYDDAVRVAARLAEQYADMGRFQDAKAVLTNLNPEGMTSVRPRSNKRHTLTYVAALQAVRASHFDEADDLLNRRLPQGGFPARAHADANQKAQQTQGPSQIDPELAAQAELLRVEALARRDDVHSLAAARGALDALEAAYDRGVGDLHVLLEMAVARSELYARASRGLRTFTFLVRTVQACLRQRYHLLLWRAVGVLARLLVAEGEFRGAQQLLSAVLPRSLETGHSETTAVLFTHLCDAYMGLAGESSGVVGKESPAKMKQCLSKAWWCLGQAQKQFVSAGCDGAVLKDVSAKRQVILSVAKRLPPMN